MYVLWMLRAAAGDKALQSALQSYDPARDRKPEYFEHLLDQASGKDLQWFFDDWVNRDRGLPDLSITGVYPSREAHQTVLVAIEIANDGFYRGGSPGHRERRGCVGDPAGARPRSWPHHLADHVPGKTQSKWI